MEFCLRYIYTGCSKSRFTVTIIYSIYLYTVYLILVHLVCEINMTLYPEVSTLYKSRSVKLKYFCNLCFCNSGAYYMWIRNLSSENLTTFYCVAAHAFCTVAMYNGPKIYVADFW
jgi:hypothetical protein